MSTTATPPPAAGPTPVRWTVEQFHAMKSHGILRDQYVMLLQGRLLEQHVEPHPRPLRFTRDQYRQLGRLGLLTGLRTELIYGVVYQMSPIGWPHVVAVNKTADVLKAAFAGAGWVNTQQPYAADESDPQPDVAVIPGRMESYTDHPSVSLLIVEVADTTLARDTTTKLELYASAGVPEYWVLDLDGRQLLVFREPYLIAAGGHSYRTHQTVRDGDSITPLRASNSTVRVFDLLP